MQINKEYNKQLKLSITLLKINQVLILSSRYINDKPTSSDRIRSNIAHSIHQILSCRQQNASNTQFIRKPSLG